MTLCILNDCSEIQNEIFVRFCDTNLKYLKIEEYFKIILKFSDISDPSGI